MKDQKQILSKLMSLDNANADKYLAKFVDELFEKVRVASNNEEVLKYLDILEEFLYKVPKQSALIIQHVIDHPLEPQIFTEIGGLKGKTHTDVVIKAIGLLKHLRYLDPKEILKIILVLTKNENKAISSKALDVVKKTAQYDFNLLTKSKIGYNIQRIVLDFMISWPKEDRLSNFDFMETATRELLGSSVEGTNMTDEKTLVFHSGAVSPTDFLKKLRKETIDFVFDIYRQTKSGSEKLKLIRVLEEACRTPGSVLYSDDVLNMVMSDIVYLAKIYREIIFDSKGKMIAEPALVAEIEKKLYWMNKSEKRGSEETKDLRKDILKDRFYSLYRLLVCDQVSYQEEEGWATAGPKRIDKITEHISSINLKNLDQWIADINLISDQQGVTDEWHFHEFKSFLRRLSFEKPEIAKKIIEDAFLKNTLLKSFVSNFLDGFRDCNRLDLWDEFVKKVIDEKNPIRVAAVCFSLNLVDDADLNEKLREEDLDILEEITSKNGRFSFLKDTKEKNHLLPYALINTLLRNYRRDPKRIEKLLVQEMKEYPEYLGMFFQQLPLGSWKKWVDWEKLGPNTLDFLQEKLIEIPDLDWHEQGLLINIAQRNLKYVLDVFKGRIEREVKIKEENSIFDRERYDAVPYHFNPELQTFISSHPDYMKQIETWIDEMSEEWSIYSWNIAEFVQRVQGSFNEIILTLVAKGDDTSLIKATRLMRSFDGGGDVNLCMEIVGKTDNKKVLSQIDSALYSTGVVMGENGIAEAYEAKAKQIEPFIVNNNARIMKYAKKLHGSFLDSAKQHRKSTEEEIKLRKLEFEG